MKNLKRVTDFFCALQSTAIKYTIEFKYVPTKDFDVFRLMGFDLQIEINHRCYLKTFASLTPDNSCGSFVIKQFTVWENEKFLFLYGAEKAWNSSHPNIYDFHTSLRNWKPLSKRFKAAVELLNCVNLCYRTLSFTNFMPTSPLYQKTSSRQIFNFSFISGWARPKM